jgi:hypothetical protein
MANMYVEKAHWIGHDGAIAVLHRSRREMFIIGGRQLGEAVHWKCMECRLK